MSSIHGYVLVCAQTTQTEHICTVIMRWILNGILQIRYDGMVCDICIHMGIHKYELAYFTMFNDFFSQCRHILTVLLTITHYVSVKRPNGNAE